METTDFILKIILPLIGIGIIIFCIGAFFFKYGASVKDRIQEIKMFGADLKVSSITVFILTGLIFVFAGTYFTVVNTNSKMSQLVDLEKKKYQALETQKNELTVEKNELTGEINSLKLSQNKTMTYFLDLEGLNEVRDINDLRITYTLWGEEDKKKPLDGTLKTTNEKTRLVVSITDLTPSAFIKSLLVEDARTKQKWKITDFFPLTPSLQLAKAQ